MLYLDSVESCGVSTVVPLSSSVERAVGGVKVRHFSSLQVIVGLIIMHIVIDVGRCRHSALSALVSASVSALPSILKVRKERLLLII
jgi:hypothetical protein